MFSIIFWDKKAMEMQLTYDTDGNLRRYAKCKTSC